MTKQSNFNPESDLKVKGSLSVDTHLAVTGNTVITGTLQVTGDTTYLSDTVTLNNANGYVINADADSGTAFLDMRTNVADANVRLEYAGATNTLLVKNDDGTVTTLGVTGDVTASATITGTTFTDGTATITGGVGTGFTSFTSTEFVGHLTGPVTGTATIADKFTNDRTLTLTGDVAGSIALGLNATSSAPSMSVTIQANSVALGTDTTGNYVATITGGTGLTSTVVTGESVTPTINLDNTAVTPATYGTAGSTGTFTVDQQGRITSGVTTPIVITASQVSDFTTAAELLLSISDAGGDGSLAYNNTTGVFTYTGPSASEVRAHLTAGTGLTVTNGEFVLDTTAVTGASYGSATAIPTFTVDAQGRLTAAADLNIAVPSSQITDFAESVDDQVNTLLVAGTNLTKVYDDAANTLTLDTGSTVILTTGNQSLAGTKTFTGSVDLTGATTTVATPSADAHVSTKKYVDDEIATIVGTAGATLDTLGEIATALGNDAALNTTLVNSIATKLPLAGGTMSGAIAMSTNKITGLGTPSATTDATTKAYVDTANTQMEAYVLLKQSIERGHTNTTTALKVNRAIRVDSPSMNWKNLSDASYTANNNINLETEVDGLDGGTPGVSFTPVLTGTEHGLITIGKQGGITQQIQGNKVISGSLRIAPGIDVNNAANVDNQGSGVLTINGNVVNSSTTLVTAGSFVVGNKYTIAVVGTTNYTLVGAANNTVGTFFIATGVGAGTGRATHHNNQWLTNVNHSFFKHTIAAGESALSILGGNIYYSTKSSEITPYLVSDTSGAGSISTASGIDTTKKLGVDQAHFQTFGNSTMYIGDIGNVATYTTVQYGGSSYTTGNRPLERLTIDGGIVLGARQADDSILVNGTVFFDNDRLKTVEGGIIKNVTTATVDTVNYTTGTGRIAINDYQGGENYLAALAQGTDISITKASNVAANVITISSNTSSIVNTAKSSLSATGANISYDGAGAFTSTVGALTTTNVAEGSNLYFTDERVDDRVSSLLVGGANVTLTYNDAAGTLTVDADLLGDITSVVAGAGMTGGATTGDATLNVIGGNGITVSADAVITDDTYIKNLFNASGSQLSYTNGIFTSTADNYNAWSFTTDTAGNQAVSSAGLVSILGGTNMDVTHSGSTITISTLADITGIIAGSGMTGGGTTGSPTLNVIGGKGITASANEIALDFTDFNTSNITENTNLYYTDARADARITASSTSALSEGTNLYYTNARADARITNALIDEDTMVTNSATKLPSQQSVKSYVDTKVASIIGGSLDLSSKDTDDLSEGSSNLYYTNARADARVDAGFTAKSTTNLSEGTNLYYTNARADARITASSTSALSEGTNLYYTNARADARITNVLVDEDNMASNSATKLPSQQSVKAYVDSQVASKDNTDEITEGSTNLYFTNARADARITAASTSDLSEGTNLYFTNARADTRANSAFDTKFAAQTTTGLSEGTNLYYTNARADARITNVLVDEDNMASNSATKLPSQQSVKAYVDSQVASKDNTDEITEGSTNLYFTNARADARITASSTSALSEGTNLYFTNARADARITKAAIDALNVDADTLDSISSASFLRSDAADTHSADITPSTNNTINLGSASNKYANVYATTFNGVATTAQYADLAENYLADADYPPGTVLVLGGEQEVTVTSEFNNSKVAGVVSTDPAHLMNSALSGQFVKAVALRGRVPVRVVGIVSKGDVLITSSTPGVAMVSSDPHFAGAACIIGKAISNKEHAGEGIVEVLV